MRKIKLQKILRNLLDKLRKLYINGAHKRAKQLSTATTPLCFCFFRCRADVLQNFHVVVRSALQNSVCLLSLHFCWSGLLQILRFAAYSFLVLCSLDVKLLHKWNGHLEILSLPQLTYRKFQAISASPNRYFTENCRWVPLRSVIIGVIGHTSEP